MPLKKPIKHLGLSNKIIDNLKKKTGSKSVVVFHTNEGAHYGMGTVESVMKEHRLKAEDIRHTSILRGGINNKVYHNGMPLLIRNAKLTWTSPSKMAEVEEEILKRIKDVEIIRPKPYVKKPEK